MLNMIRIKVVRENGNIVQLSLKGHADSDIYGKDLICAAVSAIITGGINALKDPDSFKIILKEGNAQISSLNSANKNDYQTLEVIYTQLKTVEEANKSYVEIIEKGN